MPITQDRLRNLVEENERNLARMEHLWQLIEGLRGSTNIADGDKFHALCANAQEYLCARDYAYTLLERDRIRTNWKRNERSASKMRRMRERRGQGLSDLHENPPRKPSQPRMFTSAFHHAVPSAPETPSVSVPPEPDALERELTRARELGDQERARNVERQARDPFASGD